MRCGLLGKKLGHSYSPQIHGYLADYSYELFERDPDQLEHFLKNENFTGLNVTIPYKKAVISYCHELSPRAEVLGAVNTVVRQPDGTLIGHNTDYFGFQSMVSKSGLDVSCKKVLVLGSGGASATAIAVLKELGAQVIVISRTGEDNYTNLAKHHDAAVIVNTTPVGMYPNAQESPVCLDSFPQLEGVLDVVYNPSNTALLQQAEKRALITQNGLWMLVAQAKESAEWFTGRSISDDVIPAIHKTLQQQMKNLILIGMPGSGKSTIGTLLAKRLNRVYIDADTEIVKRAGCSIPEIFSAFGEEGFRKIETQVLCELGKSSGLVIATGGGCVTREENYPLLHCNGTIIQLCRDIHQLPTEGRPLSQAGRLEDMYHIRKPMYEAFADYSVNNDTEVNQTIETILSILDREA